MLCPFFLLSLGCQAVEVDQAVSGIVERRILRIFQRVF